MGASNVSELWRCPTFRKCAEAVWRIAATPRGCVAGKSPGLNTQGVWSAICKSPRARCVFIESSSRSIFLFEHHLRAQTPPPFLARRTGIPFSGSCSKAYFTAVVIFPFSGEVDWIPTGVACLGALAGSSFGAHLVNSVNEKALRVGIVVIGLLLTAVLFIRSIQEDAVSSRATNGV